MADKDSLKVHADFMLAPDQIESLTLLYQPVFAYPALSLYMTLYEYRSVKKEVAVQSLMRMLQITHDMFDLLRQELEQFSLVRSFADDQGTLVMRLCPPLTPLSFLKHPSYGRLFDIVCGHDHFIDMQSRYQPWIDTTSLKDISKPFDLKRLAQWDEYAELQFQKNSINTLSAYSFDVEGFFKTIPEYYFPYIMRTPKVMEIIAEYGSLFKMNFSDMRSKVYESTNITNKTFNEKKFVYLIERDHGKMSVDSVDDPYDLDNVSFLKYLQKNDYVIPADLKLLKSLATNFGLNSKVINILIEYVWHQNHYDLNRNYVEKVASVWKRRNIETVADALKAASGALKQGKGHQQKVVRENLMPVYSKDASIDEDVEAIEREIFELLKEDSSK